MADTTQQPLSDDERRIVAILIEEIIETGKAPPTRQFRLKHEASRPGITALGDRRLLEVGYDYTRPRLRTVLSLGRDGERTIEGMVALLPKLKDLCRQRPDGPWSVDDVVALTTNEGSPSVPDGELRLMLALFGDIESSYAIRAHDFLHPIRPQTNLSLNDSIVDLEIDDIRRGSFTERPSIATEAEISASLDEVISRTITTTRTSAAPFRCGAVGTRAAFLLALVERKLVVAEGEVQPTHRGLLASSSPHAHALLADAQLLIDPLKNAYRTENAECSFAALAQLLDCTPERVSRLIDVLHSVKRRPHFWSSSNDHAIQTRVATEARPPARRPSSDHFGQAINSGSIDFTLNGNSALLDADWDANSFPANAVIGVARDSSGNLDVNSSNIVTSGTQTSNTSVTKFTNTSVGSSVVSTSSHRGDAQLCTPMTGNDCNAFGAASMHGGYSIAWCPSCGGADGMLESVQ